MSDAVDIFDIPAALYEVGEWLNTLATIDDDEAAAALRGRALRQLETVSAYLRYIVPLGMFGEHSIRAHKETVELLSKRLSASAKRRKTDNPTNGVLLTTSSGGRVDEKEEIAPHQHGPKAKAKKTAD